MCASPSLPQHTYLTLSLFHSLIDQTEGLPESAASPRLQLQLSSPVEERTLTAPNNNGSTTPEPSSSCTFRGVEANQATLSVVGLLDDKDDTNNSSLGSSLHDLSPLLKYDAFDLESTVEVTVVARLLPSSTSSGGAGSTDADATAAAASPSGQVVEEAVEDEEVIEVDLDQPSGPSTKAAPKKEEEEEKETEATDAAAATSNSDAVAATENSSADASSAAAAPAPSSVCTVTLRLTFEPSHKDRREELYEVLNRATQRRSVAVEKLRAAAVAEQRRLAQERAQAQSGSSSPSRTGGGGTLVKPGSSPAVRSGFLNKKGTAAAPEPPRWKVWYDKHLGPESLLRMIFPIARNYLVFAASVALMHYKGQLLALPPPV